MSVSLRRSRVHLPAVPLDICPICGLATTSAPGERIRWERTNDPRVLIVHAACARAVKGRRARPVGEWSF